MNDLNRARKIAGLPLLEEKQLNESQDWISVSWEGAGSDDIRLDKGSSASLRKKIADAVMSAIEDIDNDEAFEDEKRQHRLLVKAMADGKTVTIKFA